MKTPWVWKRLITWPSQPWPYLECSIDALKFLEGHRSSRRRFYMWKEPKLMKWFRVLKTLQYYKRKRREAWRGCWRLLFSEGIVCSYIPCWVFLFRNPTSFLEQLLEETYAIFSTIRLGPSFTLHLQHWSYWGLGCPCELQQWKTLDLLRSRQ